MAERTLPADVLRDNPRFCFGSTTFQYYPPGYSWDLEPFCGKSTCMKNKTGFYEIVNDCGVQPKPNEKCKPVIPEVRAPFPDCCPKFECLPGAKLEYPTQAEIDEQIKKAREEQIRLEEEAQLQLEARRAEVDAITEGAANAEEAGAAAETPQA